MGESTDVFEGPDEGTDPLRERLGELEQRNQELEKSLLEAQEAHSKLFSAHMHTRERLGAVLQAIPSGIIVAEGINGIIMDVNRAATDILGAPMEEIMGTPVLEYFPEEAADESHITAGPAGSRTRQTTVEGPHGKTTPVLHGVINFIADGEPRALHSITDITRQKEAEEALERASLTDALTGLCNRRAFQARIADEWNRACRTERRLSVLICDVDHFKQYNDTNGHLEGDKCLQKIASVIASCFRRSSEFTARWGGEEFAVVLSEIDMDEARTRAETLRAAVEKAALPRGPGSSEVVTISVGLASWVPVVDGHPDELMNQADEALYQAKEQGRNRVVGVGR